jgi:hypothetical protein
MYLPLLKRRVEIIARSGHSWLAYHTAARAGHRAAVREILLKLRELYGAEDFKPHGYPVLYQLANKHFGWHLLELVALYLLLGLLAAYVVSVVRDEIKPAMRRSAEAVLLEAEEEDAPSESFFAAALYESLR